MNATAKLLYSSKQDSTGKDLWCVTPNVPYPSFMILCLDANDASECTVRLASRALPSPLNDASGYIELGRIGANRVFAIKNFEIWYLVRRVECVNGTGFKYPIDSGKLTLEQALGASVEFVDESSFEGRDLVAMDENTLITLRLK